MLPWGNSLLEPKPAPSASKNRFSALDLSLSLSSCKTYHGLGGFNYRYFFLTVLEAVRSKVNVQWIWFLERTLLLAGRWLPLSVSSHGGERKLWFHFLFL